MSLLFIGNAVAIIGAAIQLILGIMNDRYLKDYIFELGFKRVKELVDEQIEDFEKAKVYKNVHVDFEGVVYNSIVWADEQ